MPLPAEPSPDEGTALIFKVLGLASWRWSSLALEEQVLRAGEEDGVSSLPPTAVLAAGP